MEQIHQKNILNYWKYMCQFSPIVVQGNRKQSERWKKKEYEYFTSDQFFTDYQTCKEEGHFLEVVFGNVGIQELYKALNLADKELVEREAGRNFVFLAIYDVDGLYVNKSFCISNFLLLMLGLTQNKLNELNDRIAEEFNKKMDIWIQNYAPHFNFDMLSLLIDEVCKELKMSCAIMQEMKKNDYGFYIKRHKIKEDGEIVIEDSIMQMDFYSAELDMILNNGIIRSHILTKLLQESVGTKIKVDDNENFIREITMPQKYPLAKWPSRYNPSLMQTVAINLATSEKAEDILAVNGPPGTGKTTLLKEIIANNIFQKAQILAKIGLKSMEANKVQSANKYYQSYYTVPSELKKLSILVASNNNAAVENITKDLPKSTDMYKENTLTKYFDNRRDDEIYFTEAAQSLFHSKHVWGLISAPYGNTSNINKLKSIMHSQKNNEHNSIFLPNEDERVDFIEAQSDFLKTLDKVKQYQMELNQKVEEIFELEEKVCKLQSQDVLEEMRQQLQEKTKKIFDMKIDLLQEEAFLKEKRENIVNSYSIFEKIYYGLKPSIKIKNLNFEINEKIDAITELEKNAKEINEKEQQIKSKLEKYAMYNNALEQYYNTYTIHTSDEKPVCIDKNFFKKFISNEQTQVSSPWITTEWNKLREELFYKSLQLIKSYIQNENGVKQNLRIFRAIKDNVETGYTKEERNKILKECYHTLNLLIPVLSTTFASVKKAFEGFDANDLGLVIIDEAGQATPFSAVGLLYRAQRCIVVGDPLQVEPVVTIPKTINRLFAEKFGIHHIEKEFIVSVDGNIRRDYKHTALSIQTLADASSRYYGKIGEMEVGCPLVVHRRCEYPMFEISNKISYDNRMINKCIKEKDFTVRDCYVVPKSCFIDISGEEEGDRNHYVSEQGKEVIRIINEALVKGIDVFNNEKALYIISPFKTVIKDLKTDLKEAYLNQPIDKEAFDKWLGNALGTVHKFQGKEADSVIMILGCDSTSQGAANWAAQQANILNVAVTRAKRRVAIIGDKNLWKKQPYFEDAIAILDEVEK